MSVRELVVLGTASQAPSRRRNHNGYLLRWDGQGVLFDPGEGTQRQLLLAGVPSSALTRICLTHFHGDHCLGLPGIVQRLSLDRVTHTVTAHYPASGRAFFHRLRHASAFTEVADLREEPVERDGPLADLPTGVLHARRLDHPVLTEDTALTDEYGHLTAAQAGRVAADCGVRRLVLSHFSQRYCEPARFHEEAAAVFAGEIIVAEDLMRVPLPRRQP
jgi:ribonuclease BN (tRNA processing enzyme)